MNRWDREVVWGSVARQARCEIRGQYRSAQIIVTGVKNGSWKCEVLLRDGLTARQLGLGSEGAARSAAESIARALLPLTEMES